jgi:hypothetical protein
VDQMNEALCKELSNEKISNTLFQIGPLKELGLDGFLACFSNRTEKY